MDVRLPNLGEGAESGSVVNILVSEGEDIRKDQNLIELESGKAVVAIPSPAAGKVGKIKVKAGDKISVGQVILSLEGASGGGAAASEKPAKGAAPAKAKKAPEPEEEERAAEEEEEPAEESGEKKPAPAASPSIRKIARDLGIDLTRVKGSERGGRIVLADVKAYIERLQKLAFSAKGGKAAKPAPAPSVDFSKWGPIAKRPMTQLRQVISERMAQSWTTIPHVTQFEEADITETMALRKKLAPAYEAQGARLTLTALALKAVVETLKKHPIFNSSIDETNNEVVTKEYYHLGLAVDTEAGLLVPVIRDVDKKNLVTLSKELNELAVKARDRKISVEDMQGGTFTISNQGGIGGTHFTPIVNKPEVAILGLGRGVTKPGLNKDGKIEARMMLPLCLSYDHRLIDGGSAARFIKDLMAAFETFQEAQIKL